MERTVGIVHLACSHFVVNRSINTHKRGGSITRFNVLVVRLSRISVSVSFSLSI